MTQPPHPADIGDIGQAGGPFGSVQDEPDLPRHQGLDELGDVTGGDGPVGDPGGEAQPRSGSDPEPNTAGTGTAE